ncbi:MAG: type II secretion system protein [Ruminococcaceae bacterium]|nr:type II secretion system protein [Oscillospiraceae bacterium]
MKLKNKSGETLIEVLVGLLIIVLVMIMLPSAVTLAAKFNKQAEDMDISTMMDRTSPITGANVTVSYSFNGSDKSISVPVDAYESDGYFFYDYE